MRERDPAPAAAVVPHDAVRRERGPAPQREDDAARLEERARPTPARPPSPAEALVEDARAADVGDTERDQADPLLHPASIMTGPRRAAAGSTSSTSPSTDRTTTARLAPPALRSAPPRSRPARGPARLEPARTPPRRSARRDPRRRPRACVSRRRRRDHHTKAPVSAGRSARAAITTTQFHGDGSRNSARPSAISVITSAA